MKKLFIIGIAISLAILFFLSSCSSKQCAYCNSKSIAYEAFFVPSGTYEYYCNDCYYQRNNQKENSSYPIVGEDLWIINPI